MTNILEQKIEELKEGYENDTSYKRRNKTI